MIMGMLHDELIAARNPYAENDILTAVEAILDKHNPRPFNAPNAFHGDNLFPANQFCFDLLERDRIFSVEQIRTVCIAYRLRFLESSRFKSRIPDEALDQISKLEDLHGTRLSDFRIMAPTSAFKLDNYDDPLLFVPLGNGYYYLVHQWGNDLNTWRKWLMLPMRNLGWFTAFCILISALLTVMLPVSRLGENMQMARLIIFLFAFKSVFAVAMYGLFMRGRNFSNAMWDSRFYNQ